MVDSMVSYFTNQILAKKYRMEGSVEVNNLPESGGSDSECSQDNDRESSGKLVAINSSIPGGLKHGGVACLHASVPLNSTIFRCHWTVDWLLSQDKIWKHTLSVDHAVLCCTLLSTSILTGEEMTLCRR